MIMDPSKILADFKKFIMINAKNDHQNDVLQERARSYINSLKSFNYTYLGMVNDFTPEQFAFLIKVAKSELNEQHDGYNFLHALAINHLYPELLKEALHQDTVNLKIMGTLEPEGERFNNTPLHLIIVNEQHKNAEFLINSAKEKQIIIDYSVQDSQGKTTLILAAKMRATAMISFIIDNIPEEKRETVLNIQDEQGNTALHYAMLLGDVESSIKLLALGASRDLENINGCTPIDLLGSTYTASIENTLESVCIDPKRDEKALMNFITTELLAAPFVIKHPRPDVHLISAYKSDNTRQEIDALVKMFVIHPLRGMEGRRETMFMTQDEKQDFVKHYNTFTGKSVKQLGLAGRSRLITLYAPHMLDLLPNSDAIDLGLRKSAAGGDLEAIRYYLEERMANPNSKSTNGNTPLHWAAQKGFIECYDYLVSRGASEDEKNIWGQTPKEMLSVTMEEKNSRDCVSSPAL